jgi:CRP-like cAMP-binding protein
MYKTSFEQLKNIPLFSFVSDEDLELIAEKLELRYFPANTQLIEEGDPGDCLYLIKNGRVKVFAKHEDLKQEIILSYLDAGDHFGEMSLISGEPRSASVVSVSDIEVWELNRSVFDSLIMNNPNITLTLTHLLTQRLKEANIARKESEEYYEQKFMPHGNLSEIHVVQLLKYAEDNSLTGEIILENNDSNAHFIYQKGQLLQLEFEGKEEDEAMDIILEWETGSYKVEPNLSKPEEQIGKEFIVEEEEKTTDSNEDFVLAYLHEKLTDFIHFAGARITQRAINRCYHNFEAYFKIIHEIKISVLPEFVVELAIKEKWGDKHTLLLAIIMRDLAAAVERDVIGMIFWTPRSTEDKINEFLESLDFFEYYDQAMELVGQ